jgi:8-oxo-dGTP pyrophosphatase MutT (NUDIX family)
VRADGDGWVECGQGHRHWGRFGAAGLLIWDRSGPAGRVVLQHRAPWSHEGGTWGLPGGARDSHESPVHAALREAGEEAGVLATDVRPYGLVVDDHGGWAYTSVLAEPAGPLDPRPTTAESTQVRWVPVDEIDALPLHPGFAVTWPRLRSAPPPLTVLIDAANVVGARGGGDGWWRDRAGAARRLRDALTPLRAGIPAAALPAATAAPATATPAIGGPATGGPATEVDVVLPLVVLVVEGAARVVATDPGGAGPGGTGTGGTGPDGTDTGDTRPDDTDTGGTDTGGTDTGGTDQDDSDQGDTGPDDTGPDTGGPAVMVLAADGSGDDAIVAAAAAEIRIGRRVLAITADRGLIARLATLGVGRVGPRWLLDRIDGPGSTGGRTRRGGPPRRPRSARS